MEGRLMSILSDRKRVAGVRRSLVLWTTTLTLLLLLPLAIVEIQAAGPADGQQAQKDNSLKEKQLQAKESEENWPSPDDFVAVDVSPQMIYTEPVVYPEDAKKAGITGDVWVKALIDKEGAVRQALVQKSSGNEQLDKAAVKAASGNKFKPALKDGQPVPVWVSYKIQFVLDDEGSDKSH
jgi:protein TonB